MFTRRVLSLTSGLRRALLIDTRRTLLSQQFRLDDEWLRRYDALSALGIAGSYEWITAVQKKFVSVGIASAVDVDAAVCAASEDDQVDDVLRIVYRLRHTINAGETLASTEYALLRLLLKYNRDDTLLEVLNDPINYGIFMNDHSACLIIDHFLKKDRMPGAMKVAATVMLQEMFNSKLLNLLCVYCALKWTELPSENRVLDESSKSIEMSESVDSDEDDERIFKFPYLKNVCNDGHFDLTDPNHLVGKSLLWFVDHLHLEQQLADNIKLIGSIYLADLTLAKQLLETCKPYAATIENCMSRTEQLLANNEQNEENEFKSQILEIKELLQKSDQTELRPKLSESFEKLIVEERDAEEEKLMKAQITEFKKWRDRRLELVQAQAEKVELTLRLADVRELQKKLREEWEMLNFFEHRERWEDIARIKSELLKSEGGKSKSREELEQEYVEQMFLKRGGIGQKK